ncbi:MAG: enoyl-CoA hydratase [Betaproteobacteria bacterium]|nr:enoyl-CoA hydratase [Betaproteobacteria bacterium]
MHILNNIADGVATVTLNRPERLNALSEEMKDTLGDILLALARDDAVRVVVLNANGRGFCASGDVTTMGRFTAATGMERLKRAHRVVAALANIEKPVIAAVRGPVAGIGWSLALACDAIVASDTAVFSQVFKNVGLIPDGGAVYFLCQHLGPIRAKDMVMTARKVPAAEALALGLVTCVVPDVELEAETERRARELSSGPTFAFGVAKKMFKQMYLPNLEAALDAEAWAQGLALLTDDHREGAAAFQEKRKPTFAGR